MAPKRKSKSELRAIWRDGIHLPGSLLWFDAPRRHHLSLVSHAHVRLGKTGKVLSTAATAALCGVPAREALLLEYGRTIDLGELHIELFPSGHMLGGAQACVTTEGGRLVYAGVVNPAGTPTARPAEIRHCDTLIVEAPLRSEPAQDVVASVEEAIAAGEHPIVVAPSPGPAQDLLLLLAHLPLVVHRDVARFSRLYGRLGVKLPNARGYRGILRRGEVLVAPRPIARLDPTRIIVPARRDRADARELVAYIEAARPRRVYVTGAVTPDFLAELSRRGISAAPLGKPHQMKLFG